MLHLSYDTVTGSVELAKEVYDLILPSYHMAVRNSYKLR